MSKRENAVTFKGAPLTLVGPELKAGDAAPDFACATTTEAGLGVVKLADTPAKARLFSVVPSLDTPVCSDQTKRFEQEIADLGDAVACYTISLDTPFAQKRFCTTESINNVKSLSDMHNQTFGHNYGVLIEGLPVPLLSRAIFVVDKDNQISYCEYVPEVTSHPDYEKAVSALKTAAG